MFAIAYPNRDLRKAASQHHEGQRAVVVASIGVMSLECAIASHEETAVVEGGKVDFVCVLHVRNVGPH